MLAFQNSLKKLLAESKLSLMEGDNNQESTLIDLLVANVKDKINSYGLIQTVNSLRTETFQVRAESIITSHTPQNPSSILNDLQAPYFYDESPTQLAPFVSLRKCMAIFEEIGNSGLDLMTESAQKMIYESLLSNPPSYSDVIATIFLYPNNNNLFRKRHFEVSLDLELILIIGEFMKTGDIDDTDLVQEYNNFLKEQMEEYGALSIYLGVWTPRDEDHSQIIRNIKIRAAALELENKVSTSFPLDELKNVLECN